MHKNSAYRLMQLVNETGFIYNKKNPILFVNKKNKNKKILKEGQKNHLFLMISGNGNIQRAF